MASSLEEFWSAHEAQLKCINFPQELVADLHKSLEKEEVGINNDFSIKKFDNSRSMLNAKKYMKKHGCVYIINHLWTCDGNVQAFQQIKKSPQLSGKLAQLFGLPIKHEIDTNQHHLSQLESLTNVFECSKETAEDVLVHTSGDLITAAVGVADGVDLAKEENQSKYAEKCTYEEFVAAMKQLGNLPKEANEAYLRKLYENFLRDGSGSAATSAYNWFDEGDIVSVYVPIPSTAKKNVIKSVLSVHHWKLTVDGKEIINGSLKASVKADDSYWSIESPGLLCMTLEKVSSESVWSELIKGEDALPPSEIMLNAWQKNLTETVYYQNILEAMWKFNQTYSMSTADGHRKEPVWFVMDELGSTLTHNNDPNFKCSPFYYIPKGKTYNLLWPVKNISEGDICTRNFIPQIMAQETIDICKVRLKAFTNRKIHKSIESCEDKTAEHVIKHKFAMGAPKENSQFKPKDVYLSMYSTAKLQEQCSKLKMNLTTDKNKGINLSIISLSETSILVNGDALPSSDLVSNKDYLFAYLKHQITDFDFGQDTFILPRELVKFNLAYERTDLPQFWIVKPADKRALHLTTVVTSNFSRVVRMCESGSISVSKFFVDQPPFHHRRFALSYTVVVSSTGDVYIYTQPLIRLTKAEYEPNELISEYEPTTTVTETPAKLVSFQEEELFSDFKVVMSKLLLLRNVEKPWSSCETQIYDVLAVIGKKLADNICYNKKKTNAKTLVVFGADFVFDDDAHPVLVDLNGVSNLPNTECLVDIMKLGQGSQGNKFCKVEK